MKAKTHKIAKEPEQSETQLKRDIMLEFGAKPGITIGNRLVGTFRQLYSEAKVKAGDAGEPDIQGRIKRLIPVAVENTNSAFNPVTLQRKVLVAQAFAIEVKKRGKKYTLREDQKRWRDAFIADGGLYVLADSIEDVYAALEEPLTTIA